MTFDEAMTEAVSGLKVRAVNMQPGAYVDYHFAGFRINFASGDSSGYTFKDIDKASEWEEYVEPPKPDHSKGWGAPKIVDKAKEAKRENQPADADRRWGNLIMNGVTSRDQAQRRADAWNKPTIDADVPPPAVNKWGQPT